MAKEKNYVVTEEMAVWFPPATKIALTQLKFEVGSEVTIKKITDVIKSSVANQLPIPDPEKIELVESANSGFPGFFITSKTEKKG